MESQTAITTEKGRIKRESVLLRIVQVLLALTTLTPLVFLYPEHAVFSFVTPKLFYFESLVALCTFFYIILLGHDRRYLPKNSALHVVVVLFVIVAIISAIFGVDTSRSFWGNFERSLGVIALIFFVAYFFILTAILNTRKHWFNFIGLFVLSSVPISIIAIVQHFNKAFPFGYIAQRSESTLGNPLYLALYMVYVIVFLLYLYKELLLKKKGSRHYIYGSSALILTAVLSFTAFWFTVSRSALIAIIVTSFFALMVIAVAHQKQKIRMWARVGVVATTLVVIALMSAQIGWWNSRIPVVTRLANVSFSNSGQTAGRVQAIKVGLKAWQDKPFLGWGYFNYDYAYNKYFDPRFFNYQYSFEGTWYDTSHSAPLDALVQGGVVGLLLYLALFAVPLVMLVGGYRRGKVAMFDMLLGGGMLVAHFVFTLFVFDQIISYLSLFILIAFIYFLLKNNLRYYVSKSSIDLPNHSVFFVAFIGLILVMYYVVYIPFDASQKLARTTNDIINDADGLKWSEGYQKMMSGFVPDVLRNDIREIMTRQLLSLNLPENTNSPALHAIFSYVVGQHELAVQSQPMSVKRLYTLGQLYYKAHEVAPEVFFNGQEKGDYWFGKALEQSPGRHELAVSWAQQKVNSGDIAAADSIMARARALSPSAAYLLHLYAHYVSFGEDEVYFDKSNRMLSLSMRLYPTFYSYDQWERNSLLLVERYDEKIGVDLLLLMLDCLSSDENQGLMRCPSIPENNWWPTELRPRVETLNAVIAYFQKTGDQAQVAKFEEKALQYYPDF